MSDAVWQQVSNWWDGILILLELRRFSKQSDPFSMKVMLSLIYTVYLYICYSVPPFAALANSIYAFSSFYISLRLFWSRWVSRILEEM